MSQVHFLKRLFVVFFASFSLTSYSQAEDSNTQSLTDFLEEVAWDQIKDSPETISLLGLSEEDVGIKTSHLLDERSPAAEEETRRKFLEAAEKLESYDFDSLSEEEQLYYSIAKIANDRGKELLKYRSPFSTNFPIYYRLSQLAGPHLLLPQLFLAAHQMKTKQDADDFVARMNAVNKNMNDFLASWKEDVEAGYLAPTFALEKTIGIVSFFLSEDPKTNPLYGILVSRLEEIEGLSDDEKAEILARGEEAITNSVLPGYKAVKAAIEEVIDQSSPEAGIWARPDGEEYYRIAVKIFGDTDLSPGEIHNIGLAEVERISSEIDAIFDSQGMTEGTVGERLGALAADPEMVFPDNDEGRAQLLAFLEESLGEISSIVPEVFSKVPEAKVEIQRVPQYAEASSPGGYYTPPPLDGSQPGVFWINLRTTTIAPRWNLKTLLYHEAIPGHHFEIARAITSKTEPFFRKTFINSAYSEGWALYSERVAKELGVYENDPFGDIGRLQAELWRAVRLVVDTGLHHERWTREEAIDYMQANLGLPRSFMVSEVERYAVWPGQALAYKMGMLKILELRERAREALGDNFDIKAFHELILGKGSMPLSIIEQRVDNWIASKTSD